MYLIKLYKDENDIDGTIIHSPWGTSPIKIDSEELRLPINDIGSLTAKIYPNNPAFSAIGSKSMIMVKNVKSNQIIFEGRVLYPNEIMEDDGTLYKEYVFEDEFSFLHDSTCNYMKLKGDPKGILKSLLDVHNKEVEPYKRFTIGNVTVKNNLPNTYYYIDDTTSTYDAIKDKLLDRDALGGELQIRKVNGVRYLDWLEKIGEKSKTEIMLAKNLISMSKEVDPSEVVTRVKPRGGRIENKNENESNASQPRVTIASVNNGVEYIDAKPELIKEFGIRGGQVTFDDVNEPKNLYAKGKTFIDNQFIATGNYKVKAVDLSLLGLAADTYIRGWSYKVVNPLMNTNDFLRITEINVNINNPSESAMSFGDRQLTMAEYQNNLKKETQKAVVKISDNLITQRNQVSSVANEVNDIQKTVSEIQSEIETADIAMIKQNLESLSLAVSNLDQSINLLPTAKDIEVIKSEIATQNQKLSDLEKKINELGGKN